MDSTNRRSARLTPYVALLILVAAFPAMGGPVLSDPLLLQQPDGSEFVAIPGGDEWFNWMCHEDALIRRGPKGWWRFTEVHRGTLTLGEARVGIDPMPRAAATLANVPALAANSPRPRQSPAAAPMLTGRTTQHPVLVILVEFQDRALSTSDLSWSDQFFGTQCKSVRQYFSEITAGQLLLVPAAENGGTANDGIVRVQLQAGDHNSGNHPDPYGTIDDTNRWIVYDALRAADPFVNFAQFDTVMVDGWLVPQELHVFVIVAGYEHGYAGDASPHPAVHGHRWSLGHGSVPAVWCDGKCLCSYNGNPIYDSGYCQAGELHNDHQTTPGELCHELGHDFGLPDLYDTTFASQGIGGFGLMGYGGWGTAEGDAYLGQTPTHMCAWSKEKIGFISTAHGSLVEATANGEYALPAAGDPQYRAVKVSIGGTEHFLIENRQLDPKTFDAGLYRWCQHNDGGTSGGGLAIWHVDTSIGGLSPNDDWTHKQCDLEEADEASAGQAGLDTWPTDPIPIRANLDYLFRAGHAGNFSGSTTPDSDLYDGNPSNVNMMAASPALWRGKCYLSLSDVTTIAWSTYFGTDALDRFMDLAIDSEENVYVAGPAGSYASKLLKFSSNGDLQYAGHLDNAEIQSIAVDSAGCVYATGHASQWFPARPSPNYGDPLPWVYDYTYNGGAGLGGDAFLAKFDSNGSCTPPGGFTTFLGGSYYEYYPTWSGADVGHGVAVDDSGQAVITGMTDSRDFPETVGSAYGHGWDGFVTKFNSDGTGVLYSRYLSEGVPAHGYPGNVDRGYGVACDSAGSAWVVGETSSEDFDPVVNWPYGYDTSYDYHDAFMVKVLSDGSIGAASYLGGASGAAYEEGFDVAIDALGYPSFTGHTSSTDFPLVDAFDSTVYWTTGDAYITQPNWNATSITYSTYYGGSGIERAYAIDIDAGGRMCLAGVSESDDLHVTPGAPMTSRQGGKDAFVGLLTADGGSLVVGTYLGGSNDDEAHGIAIGASGAIYVAGHTRSSDFPTTAGAYQQTFGGYYDGFVAKLTTAPESRRMVVCSPDGGEVLRLGQQVDVAWSSTGAGAAVKIELSREGIDGPWETLFDTAVNDGTERWTVDGSLSANCVIRVADTLDATLVDTSDATFTIAEAGDLDGDGDLDADDFDMFAIYCGGPGNPGGAVGWGAADFDDDGDVDMADLALLQSYLGG